MEILTRNPINFLKYPIYFKFYLVESQQYTKQKMHNDTKEHGRYTKLSLRI